MAAAKKFVTQKTSGGKTRVTTSNRKNPSKGKMINSKSGPIGRSSPGRITTIKISNARAGGAKG